MALRALHVWFALEPSFEKSVQTGDDASREKSAPKEFRKLLTLPVPMRDSKMLLKLLRLQLQSDPPAAPIQKIVLSGDAAAPRVAQSGLFVPKGPDPEKLELTVARLGKLVGEGNVGVAEVDGYLSRGKVSHEQICVRYRSTPSASGNMETPRPVSSDCSGRSPFRDCVELAAGFRIIRPPMPVRVELREHCPVRVFFRGVQRTRHCRFRSVAEFRRLVAGRFLGLR